MTIRWGRVTNVEQKCLNSITRFLEEISLLRKKTDQLHYWEDYWKIQHYTKLQNDSWVSLNSIFYMWYADRRGLRILLYDYSSLRFGGRLYQSLRRTHIWDHRKHPYAYRCTTFCWNNRDILKGSLIQKIPQIYLYS